MNRILESLFRCLACEHLRTWDSILSSVEFAYSSLVNRTTSLSLFEIVISYRLRTPINFIPMSATHRPSEFASTFASHIHSLHKEIHRKIILSNENYKRLIDSHRVYQEFQEGDYVMMKLRPKRFC